MPLTCQQLELRLLLALTVRGSPTIEVNSDAGAGNSNDVYDHKQIPAQTSVVWSDGIIGLSSTASLSMNVTADSISLHGATSASYTLLNNPGLENVGSGGFIRVIASYNITPQYQPYQLTLSGSADGNAYAEINGQRLNASMGTVSTLYVDNEIYIALYIFSGAAYDRHDNYVWHDFGPSTSELTLTFQPLPLQVPRLQLQSLQHDNTNKIDTSYEISGADLPTPSTIDYYWASGPTFDKRLSTIPVRQSTTQQAIGVYSVSDSLSAFGLIPFNAMYLVAVVTSPNGDTQTMSASVLPGRMTLSAVTLDSSDVVTLIYSVLNAELPHGGTIDFYWGTGPSLDERIGITPVRQSETRTEVGTYSESLPLSSFGTSPSNAKYLIGIVNSPYADPDHKSSSVILSYTPKVLIKSVSTVDSKSLFVDYEIQNNDLERPTEIDVYRSPVSVYSSDASSSSQVLIAHLVIGDGQDLSGLKADANGQHIVEITPPEGTSAGGFQFFQAQALRPDPSHPYVIATGVDPTNRNAPPQAEFRIFLVGAVIHGYVGEVWPSATGGSIVPSKQTFIDDYAKELTQIGNYDSAFAFHWENIADLKVSAMTTVAALILSSKVSEAAATLTKNPNDVVDLNLIGWSRGAVVATEAMSLLKIRPVDYDSHLEHGFMMETLIDPHPANNFTVNFDSGVPNWQLPGGTSDAYLQLYGLLSFQDVAKDPKIEIPSNVQAVADFWQNNFADQFPFSLDYLHSERILNLWGLSPDQITSPVPIQAHPQTYPGIGHTEIFKKIYHSRISMGGTLSALGLMPFGDPLEFTSEPPATLSRRQSFGTVVTAKNIDGSVNSSFNGPVTIGDYYGTLNGTITVNAVNGVAIFSGLSFETSGEHQLFAKGVGQTTVQSTYISVTSAIATQLMAVAPSNVVAGGQFDLTVSAVDSAGTIDPTFAGLVTLSLHNNIGGTLGGKLTSMAVRGVATFTDLTLSNAASGYTIQASSPGLDIGITSSFDVEMDQFVVAAQPPAQVASGNTFGLIVSARNSAGEIDSTYNGPVTLIPLGSFVGSEAILSGSATVMAVNGVATFSGLALTRPGNYSLLVTGNGVGSTTTNTVQASSASAFLLKITSPPPAMVTVGAAFDLEVSIQDSAGNVDTSFNGNVTIALGNNPGAGALSGTLTVLAVNGSAKFTSLKFTASALGYTLVLSSAGLGTATTGAINVTRKGIATQLAFTKQPPDELLAGAAFSVTVEAEDSFGVIDPNFNGSIKLALNNPSLAPKLSGMLTITAVKGIATFSGLSLGGSGDSYALAVASGNLNSANSNSLRVNPGKATQLVISPLSANVLVNSAFGVTVFAEDGYGNVDSNFNGLVTLTLANNPGNAKFGGTLKVYAVNGVANFTGLAISVGSIGYSLQSTGLGLKAGNSAAFNVTKDQLIVTKHAPLAVPTGNAFDFVVSAVNASGSIDTSYLGNVTLSLFNFGTTPATLNGTLTAFAVNGIAKFSNLSVNSAGYYELLASGVNIGSVASNLLSVVSQAPAITTPSTITFTAGQAGAFLLKATGFPLPTFSTSVAPPSGVNLTATGMLTSTGETPAGSYSFVVSASNGFAIAATQAFTLIVKLAVPSTIVFTQAPPSSGIAGVSISPSVKVAVEDQYGKVVTTDSSTVTLQLMGAGTSISYSAKAVKGIATFNLNKLLLTKSGSYAFVATDSNAALSRISSNLTINPAAANKILLTTVPNVGTAGTMLGTVVATVADLWGNPVPTDHSTVKLSVKSGPGTFTKASTLSATAVAGVATFNDLTLSTSGTYTLIAADSNPALTSGISSSVSIAPATASKLIVIQNPVKGVAGAALSAVTVAVADTFGNVLTNVSSSVTLTLASGKFADGSTTASTNIIGGVATFANLIFNVSGNYTLNFTNGTLLSASLAATIKPAAANKLIFVSVPVIGKGNTLLPQIVVAVEDIYGNVVTDNSSSVTIAVNTSNPIGVKFAPGSTLVANAIKGIVYFSNLKLNTIGTYTLKVSDGSLSKAVSGNIVIS